MPFYHKLGNIPHKRHTQFRKKDGSLYSEELMGTRGFSGIQSILYHVWPPTAVLNAEILREEKVEFLTHANLEHRHLVTCDFSTSGDPITSRVWLLGNPQVKLGLATPTQSMNYFYRNAQCDELIFVHEGTGVLHSQFGELAFRRGDYIVLPVGITYQLEVQGKSRLLVLEANSRIEVPTRYRNEYGQFLERSPYCERDIRVPDKLVTHEERGQFEIQIRTGNRLNKLVLDHHPFDVKGWDGFLYPWIFNIEDFEPITGRIHQPPPVHQTFSGEGFVVCSFVPRLFDYHPQAVPVPYSHSNVNSDEVLYYVAGDFMSRKGIKQGSFTLHPAGLPHGPHPGTVEKSLGQKETKELAVMVDTFAPLHLTQAGMSLIDPEYVRTWLE